MFDVVAKLMFHKQLAFEEGSIKLLNQNVVIFPIVNLFDIQVAMEEVGRENKLYDSSKKLGKLWIEEIFKAYAMNTIEEQVRWGETVVTLAGFGKMKVVNWDVDKKEMIYQLHDSSLAKLYGKVGRCVDHVPRGWYAGASSAFFHDDIDCVELKCIAKDDPYCEFATGSLDNLRKFNGAFKSQFPNK